MYCELGVAAKCRKSPAYLQVHLEADMGTLRTQHSCPACIDSRMRPAASQQLGPAAEKQGLTASSDPVQAEHPAAAGRRLAAGRLRISDISNSTAPALTFLPSTGSLLLSKTFDLVRAGCRETKYAKPVRGGRLGCLASWAACWSVVSAKY